ncbi:hypothetical protein MMC30_003136 [Trapelia coarctata]|nr:hypothetical protein [Trapelia coarctata]
MRGHPDYSETILTTWSISYSAVVQKNEDAAKLLRLWGYLDSQDVWYELLKWQIYQDAAPEWLRRITATESAFFKTIQALVEFSLIEEEESSDSYSMHSVVHDWIRWQINQSKTDGLARTSVCCVGLARPRLDSVDQWTRTRRLLPNCIVVARRFVTEDYFLDYSDDCVKTSLESIGDVLVKLKNYEEAGEFYSSLLSRAQNSLGIDHGYVLTIMLGKAALQARENKPAEADPIFMQVFERLEAAPSLNYSALLRMGLKVGIIYREQGRWDIAGTALKIVLKGSQNKPGGYREIELAAIQSLAGVYAVQGNLTEAEALSEQVFNSMEKELSMNNALTLAAGNLLGSLYMRMGKLTQGHEILTRVLMGQEKLLGKEHPESLDTVYMLARLCLKEGKLLDYKAMLERAVTGYRETFGADHEVTLAIVADLERLEPILRIKEEILHTEEEVLRKEEMQRNKEMPHNEEKLLRNKKRILRNKAKILRGEEQMLYNDEKILRNEEQLRRNEEKNGTIAETTRTNRANAKGTNAA